MRALHVSPRHASGGRAASRAGESRAGRGGAATTTPPVGIDKQYPSNRSEQRCTPPSLSWATHEIVHAVTTTHHSPQKIMQTIIQRDTRAWTLQVWISFAIAVFLCATGLAYLPGQDIDRAFMIMGYLFCLSATFVLSKFVRDNAHEKADTPMWRWVVYGAFLLAMTLTGWGLWRMNINETYKAFLLVSWLYLTTSTFTLAKTLRDSHDADRAEARG